MSLILEALKKLEREKRSSEPGFLVLGPTSWPGAPAGRRRALLAAGALALLAVALAVVMVRRPGATPARPLAATPASLAVPSNAASASRPPVHPTPSAVAVTPIASPEIPVEPEPRALRREEPPTPQAPQAPPARFTLQAISRRDGRPVAVLNERLVYEGESFDGVTVVRIGEAEVELTVDGRRVVIGF